MNKYGTLHVPDSMTKLVGIFAALAVLAAAGPARADKRPDTITLVVVGDVGLNRSGLDVDPRGVLEGRGVLPWAEMTSGIEDLIDGDLNFMNLETVVTDRNDLTPGDKKQKTPYLFRSHPKGVEHLADIGFNLVSAANNHAYDYGEDGVLETIKSLAAIANKKKGFHWAGIGKNRAKAAKPAVFSHRGARIAFASIGIVTNMLTFHRASEDKAGSLGYRYEEDWKLTTGELNKAKADIKLLSIHYGKERDVKCDSKQLDEWRWAASKQGADVVIGHHAHVVRGVELHDGKVIFYGLGNFLIRGARDMRSQKQLHLVRDYGLLGKVHFELIDGDYRVRAIEIVPIVDMHRKAKRWDDVEESKKRVEVVNALADQLDAPKSGSKGVRFQVRDDGSGLFCVDGAKRDKGSIGKLCKSFVAPTKASEQVKSRVSATSRREGKAKRNNKSKKRRKARRRKRRSKR